MPLPALKIDAEELLQHLGWMKRLALSMLGDEALAEDAVSETYLRVLRKPPSAGVPLGGWLNTTLKRNVLQSMRSRRRRENFQQSAQSQIPSSTRLEPADPLEQAEATEYAVKALRKLEEPYRTTLLLHFFRDMDAPAIAKQLGITVSGVHTRLDRGKKLLRAQFREQYDGNWAAPMLLALGYKPLALSTLVAGASATSWGLPAVLILAAGASAAGLAWQFGGGQPEPAPVEAAELPAPSAADTDGAGPPVSPAGPAAPPSGPGRLAAAPPPPASSSNPGSSRWPLRVVTPSGDAVARVLGWNRARQAPLSVLVSEQPFGSLHPAPEARVRHSVPDGRFVTASYSGPFPESGQWPMEYLGTLESDLAPPFHVAVALGPVILGQTQVSAGATEATITTPATAVRSNLARARARLVDESGAKLTSGQVSLLGLDGKPFGWVDQPSGTWQLADLVPGSVVLRASAPDRGALARWVSLQPGDNLDLGDLVLPAPTSLTGSLRQADGSPAPEVILRLEPMRTAPDGEPFLGYLAALTDENGDFRITGAAPGLYQLLAQSSGLCRGVLLADTRAGDVDLGAWQLPASAPVTFRPDFSSSPFGWVVTIRDQNTGARLHSSRMKRPLTLQIPDGSYQVEIGDIEAGHRQVCTTFTVAGAALEVAFQD